MTINPLTAKKTHAEVRRSTARLRDALRDLPTDVREYMEGMNREDDIRSDLHEIIGSASHIADLLGIEL